jgi:putative hydrolase of the HAD superfamily
MAILFDLGAVVFRWQPAVLLQTALPRLAAEPLAAQALATRFFQSFHVGSDWAEFDRGVLDEEQVVGRLAARLGLPLPEVQTVLDAIPAHLVLRHDTVNLALELKSAGHALFYLSNMPTSLIAHVHPHLQAMGCFSGGIYSSTVKMVKPELAIFELAQRQFSVAPEEICFLDDSRGNVAAARSLGWQAWEFVDAAGARRDLQQAGVQLMPRSAL